MTLISKSGKGPRIIRRTVIAVLVFGVTLWGLLCAITPEELADFRKIEVGNTPTELANHFPYEVSVFPDQHSSVKEVKHIDLSLDYGLLTQFTGNLMKLYVNDDYMIRFDIRVENGKVSGKKWQIRFD